jgi:hypothetical protein
MEFSNNEIGIIERTTTEAADSPALELDELELALVGGGNHLITCG